MQYPYFRDYIKNCKNAAFSIKRETKNKKYEKIEDRKSSLQSILEFLTTSRAHPE